METRVFDSPAALRAAIGTELGPGDWLEVEQERIDGFAEATEDHQWIHTDPERAAEGPFGSTVAHGYLTLSLLPALTSRVLRVEGVRMGVNYGLNKVRFPAPVPVGSRLRARVLVADVEEVGGGVQLTATVTVEREGGDRPVCVATTVSRFSL
ncbi:MaoC family dehydratase [Streptomyces durbertensis]|uniref:MaoC family dehydratase n=1 Tax=Streptomyces durbertensis TaxID=2448886 RepID=A0ABR6EF93_9ACTN|nr:MaoC/PaaZ C-terminal domain-containing protein [Streptomyces durbertensis]MBB1244014.1 MaoC family dehydratase [Streptomyces durbertensis]